MSPSATRRGRAGARRPGTALTRAEACLDFRAAVALPLSIDFLTPLLLFILHITHGPGALERKEKRATGRGACVFFYFLLCTLLKLQIDKVLYIHTYTSPGVCMVNGGGGRDRAAMHHGIGGYVTEVPPARMMGP
jgi:hypothetical protein